MREDAAKALGLLKDSRAVVPLISLLRMGIVRCGSPLSMR